MNADGSGTTRLTNSPGFDENPSWSPDGKRIAFDSMRDGNLEAYVMDADGTDQARHQPPGAGRPADLVAGLEAARLRQRANREGQRRLFVVRPDGTGARMPTRGAFDMSPDWARG